jgi:hypothetical protein
MISPFYFGRGIATGAGYCPGVWDGVNVVVPFFDLAVSPGVFRVKAVEKVDKDKREHVRG